MLELEKINKLNIVEEIKTVEDFKLRAYEVFENDVLPANGMSALNYLYSLDWKISPGDPFSEEEMTLLNLSLDTRGCFGRAVKAAVLVENLFPHEEIYCGEVREDLLRKILMDGMSEEEWDDQTYVEEILQYENPHMIIVFGQNLKHFDPIFNQLSPKPEDFFHPSIILHDLWKGLYCMYLVSLALYKKKQESERSAYRTLKLASSYCPESILVKENLLGSAFVLDQHSLFSSISSYLLDGRACAKTLWFMYLVTRDDLYKNRIISEYNIQMFKFLNSTTL